MAVSTYLANLLLDRVLRADPFTAPTTVYLALHEEDPQADASGAELSGGSYVRIACTWYSASDAETSNDASIDFTDLPAADITHGSIWDDEFTGNMLFYGPFDDTITTIAGDDLSFDIGSLAQVLV